MNIKKILFEDVDLSKDFLKPGEDPSLPYTDGTYTKYAADLAHRQAIAGISAHPNRLTSVSAADRNEAIAGTPSLPPSTDSTRSTTNALDNQTGPVLDAPPVSTSTSNQNTNHSSDYYTNLAAMGITGVAATASLAYLFMKMYDHLRSQKHLDERVATKKAATATAKIAAKRGDKFGHKKYAQMAQG